MRLPAAAFFALAVRNPIHPPLRPRCLCRTRDPPRVLGFEQPGESKVQFRVSQSAMQRSWSLERPPPCNIVQWNLSRWLR